MDWLDLLAVQGFSSLLQHHSSKASVLWCSAFFTIQLSHPYMTTGKEYVKAIYCHPTYLTYMQSTSCKGPDELQAGIKIIRRNTNNLRYADDTTLMAESEEQLKSLPMGVKVESKKAGLKLNIKKTKITASSPISSWKMEGKKVEVVTDFIFLGSKITVDGDCRETKRCLLLGRKAMTNLDSI